MGKNDVNSICLIGSGNVATHLARAWRAAGLEICCVCSPTPGHAEELAREVGCAETRTDFSSLPKADAYVLCVKDDELPAVAAQVTAQDCVREALVAHTAGSVALDVLPECECGRAVLYPLQTFSKHCPLDMSGVPFLVEGATEQALDKVTQLAAFVSRDVHTVCSDDRRKLHLAAVFANNFTNHCLALSEMLAEEAGLDGTLLRPIVAETLRKAAGMPAREAQTGPAARWDEAVMRRQRDALAAHPEAQAVYEAMSRSIHALARRG